MKSTNAEFPGLLVGLAMILVPAFLAWPFPNNLGLTGTLAAFALAAVLMSFSSRLQSNLGRATVIGFAVGCIILGAFAGMTMLLGRQQA
jgi:hypothetical protein